MCATPAESNVLFYKSYKHAIHPGLIIKRFEISFGIKINIKYSTASLAPPRETYNKKSFAPLREIKNWKYNKHYEIQENNRYSNNF